MIDKDVAAWLLELLSRMQVPVADPEIERIAGLAVRARAQLAAITADGAG